MVVHPGGSRRRIVRTLGAAYAGGLLSEETFVARLDQALRSRVVDPSALVGDLKLRRTTRVPAAASVREWLVRLAQTVRLAQRVRLARPTLRTRPARPNLLALDWSGAEPELLIGRHHACDLVLANPSVSRRHARLVFRDAKWIVQDLESRNGTIVNGVRVGRCELRPGDRLVLGDAQLEID